MNTIETIAVPTWLRCSEMAITFDRDDHPDHVPHPGRYPLEVHSIVGTTHLSRVLMDSSSGLNILNSETLDKMNIPWSSLRLS